MLEWELSEHNYTSCYVCTSHLSFSCLSSRLGYMLGFTYLETLVWLVALCMISFIVYADFINKQDEISMPLVS